MQYHPIEKDPQPADRLILWLPVFMCMGIGTYFLLPFEPSLRFSGITLAVAASLFAVPGFTVPVLRQSLLWRWIAAFILVFIGSFLLIQVKTHHQAQNHMMLHYDVWNKEVHGTIAGFERVGTGWRVVLEQAKIEQDRVEQDRVEQNKADNVYTLRLTIRKRGFTPEEGGTLRVKASIMAPSAPMVPHSFDFRRHAFYRGISGYGYATQIVDYRPPPPQYHQNRLEAYRDWLTDRVYNVLEQPDAGIVTALLNGQRAGITKKSTSVLQQSGLQHVISISGLHVSLLAITIFFSIRLLLVCNMRIAIAWPVKKIAAFCALIGIVFYLLIVGSSPPTLRAVLVTGAALCAIMLDREPIQMRVVALAAMGILLLEPESLIDIGFQMSFAAVIGLVAFYQYSRAFWTHIFWKRNIVFKIALLGVGTIATSIVATIVTAPLVLLYFQQVPLLSMLANVLASPAITFLVMPGTFLAYLFTPFPVLGDMAIHMMGLGVENMMFVANFVASLPSSVWRIPSLPLPVVVLVMLGLWMVVTLPRLGRYAGMVLVVAACAALPFYSYPDLYLTADRVVLYPDQDKDILYVDGRLQKFNRDMMLQWTATRKAQDFPEQPACEQDICVMKIKGKTIRFIRTVPALEQACDQPADLVVTRFYLDHYCRNMPVLDRHKLRLHGGYAVYLQENGIKIQAVYPSGSGKRPWQRQDRRKTSKRKR